MVIFCMHPIKNLPRPINSAAFFGKEGYQVLVVGYHDTGLSKFEKLGKNAWLIRLPLSSRKIRLSFIRYLFSLCEYLIKCIKIYRRISPGVVITFNEIASILHAVFLKSQREVKRVAWLLEFPENVERNVGKWAMFKISAYSWKFADIVVAPTKERLAMASVLQPQLISKRLFVVQNSSLSADDIHIVRKSSKGFEEVKSFLNEPEVTDSVKIIYAGAIGNRYGLAEIVQAVGKFSGKISLLILGKKHDLALREYNEALKTVSNKSAICWVDSVDYREMSKILSLFDVGFVTYTGDTLNTYFAAPGKAYEYLKAGLILLTDSSLTIYDDLLANDCGIFFHRPIESGKIETQLNVLLEKKISLNRMKQNAKDLYLTRYSFEQQIGPLALELSQDALSRQ